MRFSRREYSLPGTAVEFRVKHFVTSAIFPKLGLVLYTPLTYHEHAALCQWLVNHVFAQPLLLNHGRYTYTQNTQHRTPTTAMRCTDVVSKQRIPTATLHEYIYIYVHTWYTYTNVVSIQNIIQGVVLLTTPLGNARGKGDKIKPAQPRLPNDGSTKRRFVDRRRGTDSNAVWTTSAT